MNIRERTTTESAFAPTSAEERPRDTRTRIQEIALRLFTEQGYEATSLREIAEVLGVTKAALYYHFKTKEDIVASLVVRRTAFLDQLIDWVRDQPRTPEVRREAVRRYAASLTSEGYHEIMRFLERNQTALKNHPDIGQMRAKMVSLCGHLVDPTAPPEVRLKGALALFALHAALFLLPDEDLTEADRADAALKVALELIDA
ncbi:TetR/AcrR family transcriptional regulator [Acrocarpospora catenulata]|uniref:TetR/AcrR family transcriptional regulator n=1 Tax=Acrocarpospora catenulata TaxID=2836182 RepID=UPI0027DFB206|nr:helix-turn-helix domain-containing protein [Acrocarpospora catenulata]